MRLWHYDLIKFLPRQQLLGQHRECCALRGNGWGRKHATVDYVFKYSPIVLFIYHSIVIHDMTLRGYTADFNWQDWAYRGKGCEAYKDNTCMSVLDEFNTKTGPDFYPEHDDAYLNECIANLESKGIDTCLLRLSYSNGFMGLIIPKKLFLEGANINMTRAEMLAFIEKSDYETLLKAWRFTPTGHELFQGEIGKRFSEALKHARNSLPIQDQVFISKKIGWSGTPV